MTASQPREVGLPLTDRELAVLDLAAGGLITVEETLAALRRDSGVSYRPPGG
jgi:hypothetical protein